MKKPYTLTKPLLLMTGPNIACYSGRIIAFPRTLVVSTSEISKYTYIRDNQVNKKEK